MSTNNIEKLIDVIAKLRDPKDGCPWDLKQTHESLLRYLIEESYEFVHAVETGDDLEMEEEIGDILLQVVLHCQLAHERGQFDFDRVAGKLADKMIRRHPHVFDKQKEEYSVEEIKQTWDAIKKTEKEKESRISNDVLSFPALYSSFKIGKKTEKIKFDWDDHHQVIYKVEEEWQELKEELAPRDNFNKERVQEELGDFLFSIAQLARHLDMDPEETLRAANKKFLRRFQSMENIMDEEGIVLEDLDQDGMEEFWFKAKMKEKE